MIRTTLAALALGGMALFAPAIAHADPFDQRDYPCQEDEVLGYAPRFGPDRVGCIHIEEVQDGSAYEPITWASLAPEDGEYRP